MKNIRILEDGNRLIVVLEGYEKSAVSALMEMLGTVVAPPSHIRPHTGEGQFRPEGTEKEGPLPKQGAEIPIKPPVFMEQMQAGITADTKTRQKPAEFMNSFELRACIRKADGEKLSAVLKKKGRFPNAMHLLNSDDKTIREYVKELLLTA
ncbi:hypothetical protein [Otoolea muris]|uniref:hypothetical protein n=1 Tax=Otoolea muris TaxID=2941515 RepID=UPI00203B373E|nr:hypothetical protein [Otoolea muris]